jgi:hypothetical protein
MALPDGPSNLFVGFSDIALPRRAHHDVPGGYEYGSPYTSPPSAPKLDDVNFGVYIEALAYDGDPNLYLSIIFELYPVVGTPRIFGTVGEFVWEPPFTSFQLNAELGGDVLYEQNITGGLEPLSDPEIELWIARFREDFDGYVGTVVNPVAHPPTMITDLPPDAPIGITVLDRRLTYDQSAAINGADWHDEPYEVEAVWMPAPPLGKTSITFLGLTATWDYVTGYWHVSSGAESLVIVPAYALANNGKLPVAISRYYGGGPPSAQVATGAVDLIAALAAGHVTQTGSSTPITDVGNPQWTYVDTSGTPFVFPDYPGGAPVGLTTANQAINAGTSGYSGPKLWIADYRDDDDEWTFKKVGNAWVIDSTYGNGNNRNAPDWQIGAEAFYNHRGFDYTGVPVDYKLDHIGPDFSGEPDWFKTGG